MKYSDELLLHFTCDFCKMWWSVAISWSDKWKPNRTWYCTWCGHKHEEPHEKIPE